MAKRRKRNKGSSTRGRWPTSGKAGKLKVIKADGTEIIHSGANPYARTNTYWQSKAWKRMRMAALARDRHRCSICRRKNGDEDPRLKPGRTAILEVHHKTYERYGHERLDDLAVLCQRCHATEHQWLKRGVSQL